MPLNINQWHLSIGSNFNQPPMLNAGLQAANAAQLKAKISNLKKQVKGDTITMEATLFYYPKSSAAAKKVDSDISCSFTLM
jgi:hypothetical protein